MEKAKSSNLSTIMVGTLIAIIGIGATVYFGLHLNEPLPMD